MILILKYFFYSLFIPIWWIQLLIPRNDNIWIFGAWFGKKYSDNSKILFEYILANRDDIKVVWLTRNPNLKKYVKNCYGVNSLKGIYYSLIAGKVIYSSGKSDINRFFINGSQIFMLWHGAPMKKIALDDTKSASKIKNFVKRYIYPFIYGYNQNAVISTAKIFNDKLCSAFNTKEHNILLTGYPRNDIFFTKSTSPLIIRWNRKFKNPNKIIYLPTFRDDNKNFNSFNDFNFNINHWNNFLEKSNSILIYKGHFVSKKSKNILLNSERIIILEDDMIQNINYILKDIDILITDYSGVYFDFLLTRKPIILAPFDYENYIINCRELYFDYFNEIEGDKCLDWDQILSLLIRGELTIVNEKFMKKFNYYNDGKSCKRLTNEILKFNVKN